MTYFNTKIEDIEVLPPSEYPKKQLEVDSKIREDMKELIKRIRN